MHIIEMQTTIWRMQLGNEVWVCWPVFGSTSNEIVCINSSIVQSYINLEDSPQFYMLAAVIDGTNAIFHFAKDLPSHALWENLSIVFFGTSSTLLFTFTTLEIIHDDYQLHSFLTINFELLSINSYVLYCIQTLG